jgi:hypothetical protein
MMRRRVVRALVESPPQSLYLASKLVDRAITVAVVVT